MIGLATLPMYDWPEARAKVDAFYVSLRKQIPELPETLTRPETEEDIRALWRDPQLLLGQTCWGPLKAGLAEHVHVLAQPLYDDVAGGYGTRYRSAIIMREGSACPVPQSGDACLPNQLARLRLAINAPDSLSGALALAQDTGMPEIAKGALITGSHRASIRAVAEGRADYAAIDCRTWAMALEHEPLARDLTVTGWTALRPGLPFIVSRHISAPLRVRLTQAIAELGAQPACVTA